FWLFMQDNLFSFLSLAFSYELIHSIKLLIAIRRSELFPRVRLCDFWAVECSRAWDCAISERWTVPARGIVRFLGGGPFLRVKNCVSRVMELVSVFLRLFF